jgi:hypothetical protein
MKKLLGENKLAYLAINYVDTRRISKEDLDKIVSVDITQSKIFSEWIVKQFITDPTVEEYFPELSKAIQAYVKYNDVLKEINFKNLTIDAFVNEVRNRVSKHMKPQIENSLNKALAKYKAGTVLAHDIYVLPKGALDVSPIINSIGNLPQNIVEYGDVIYVVSNTNKYVISFDADIYLDQFGNSLPIKQQNVDLWDTIFTWLYTNDCVHENIIACVDLFGNNFDTSKLAKAIESHNPKEVFSKYYSNQNNKLINLIVNPNGRATRDYARYIDKYKNLGFGIKGILVEVDLGSEDVAEIKSNFSDDEYEANVKAHFKRTGQSFDSTTFENLKAAFMNNSTLFFFILRDGDPTSGIFLESGNTVVGFLSRDELSFFMAKFHSARRLNTILQQLNPEVDENYSEYESELKTIKTEIDKIIDNSKSMSHYIII